MRGGGRGWRLAVGTLVEEEVMESGGAERRKGRLAEGFRRGRGREGWWESESAGRKRREYGRCRCKKVSYIASQGKERSSLLRLRRCRLLVHSTRYAPSARVVSSQIEAAVRIVQPIAAPPRLMVEGLVLIVIRVPAHRADSRHSSTRRERVGRRG